VIPTFQLEGSNSNLVELLKFQTVDIKVFNPLIVRLQASRIDSNDSSALVGIPWRTICGGPNHPRELAVDIVHVGSLDGHLNRQDLSITSKGFPKTLDHPVHLHFDCDHDAVMPCGLFTDNLVHVFKPNAEIFSTDSKY